MAEFDFRCGDCNHSFSLNQSLFAKRPKACPVCRKRKNFGQVISAPIGARGEPRTVGSLAEKNTKKLCKEDYDRIMGAGKIDGLSPAMQQRVEQMGGKVKGPRKKDRTIPWYRDGSVPGTVRSEKPIDITKISDVNKFIETGKHS